MADLNLNIKAANDKKFEIKINAESTISQLKAKISGPSKIPADQQRLIYSGKILNDAEKISTYNFSDRHTIHLIKTNDPAKRSSSAQTSQDASQQIPQNIAAGSSISNPLTQLTGARFAGQVPIPDASLFGPDAGMGGAPAADYEEMIRMLENPMVQSQINEMWQNPMFIDMLMNSMPQFRNSPPQVREMLQSAEFRRMLTDPTVLRQMVQMQQNIGQGFGSNIGSMGSFPMPGRAQDQESNSNNNNTQAPNLSNTAQNVSGQDAGISPALIQTMLANLNRQSRPANDVEIEHGNTETRGSNNPSLAGESELQAPNLNFLNFLQTAQNSGNSEAQMQSNVPLEERYAEQIGSVVAMGFEYQRAKRACILSGGIVPAAIELLLNGDV